MTESEWLRCTESQKMLTDPDRGRSTRQWNLILCGISRIDWDLLKDEGCRRAVEIAEQNEDGLASRRELEAAHDAAVRASMEMQGKEKLEVVRAAGKAYRATVRPGVLGPPVSVAEDRRRCEVIRDILGPLPFRPMTIEPDWRTPDVTVLARQIYDERSFDRLPELADALERAGCSNLEVLNHCRSTGEHWRGCWVLDLLLGKEHLSRHARRSK